MSEKQGIFLLGLKKSKKREGVTYCIGVFRLGTTNMEFILGETDNDREYRQGEMCIRDRSALTKWLFPVENSIQC